MKFETKKIISQILSQNSSWILIFNLKKIQKIEMKFWDTKFSSQIMSSNPSQILILIIIKNIKKLETKFATKIFALKFFFKICLKSQFLFCKKKKIETIWDEKICSSQILSQILILIF